MTTHPLLLALLAAVGMTCPATAQVSTSEQLAEEVLEAFQSRTDPRAPCRTIGDITIYDSQLGTSSPAIRVTDSTLHVNGGFFVGGQGSKISSSAYDGGEALAANQSTVFLSKVQMYGGFGGGGNFQSPFTGPSGGAAVSCIDSTLHVRGGRGGLIRGGDGGIGGWSGTQHGPGGSGIILDSMSSLFTTPNVNIEGGIRSLGGQYEKVAIAVDSNGTWSQLPEDRSSFGLSTRTPSPGELVIAEYDGAPDSIAIGLVSYFQASPHILLGAAGPVLISSTSYMVLPTVTLDHSGFATNTLAVPGDSALIGETIFLQTLGWNVSGALSFSSPVMVAINS